jgi:hypothetical protein
MEADNYWIGCVWVCCMCVAQLGVCYWIDMVFIIDYGVDFIM